MLKLFQIVYQQFSSVMILKVTFKLSENVITITHFTQMSIFNAILHGELFLKIESDENIFLNLNLDRLPSVKSTKCARLGIPSTHLSRFIGSIRTHTHEKKSYIFTHVLRNIVTLMTDANLRLIDLTLLRLREGNCRLLKKFLISYLPAITSVIYDCLRMMTLSFWIRFHVQKNKIRINNACFKLFAVKQTEKGLS